MTNIKDKAVSFLKKHKMDVSDVDIDSTVGVYLDEMERGLAGCESSLKMLPTYLSPGPEIPAGKKVIVLDAGGTNFRVATLHFDQQHKPVIENFSKHPIPGIEKEVTSEEFFSTLTEHSRGVLDQADTIGFCFSYPCEIMPDKDGKLIHFSKEVKAKQVEGQMIGQNLNKALNAAGYDTKHIVILNDTVTTLLAAKANPEREFDDYIGFILGTGTNICYTEQNKNITKASNLDPGGSQIINVESGNFAKAPMGKIDKLYDASTINPGLQNFEKMISGAYLGPLCLAMLKTAVEDNLFSSQAAQNIENMVELQTKDINSFMHNPLGQNPLTNVCVTEDELVLVYHLADRLIDRAAKLTAVNLSATSIKTGRGQNPLKPICIVAEGTTFYRLKSLKSRVEAYLREYLESQKGIYTEIVHIDNSTLLGAAIAGLTN